MPGGLPQVLVTNTETIIEEIDNNDRVQVEDVAKLWRVYTLNSAHIEADEGARLSNFFWRIWSNRSISSSLRGSTLARLFITISEGGDRVRTTPVPTSLAATPIQNTRANPISPSEAGVSQASEMSRHHLESHSKFDDRASLFRTSHPPRPVSPILEHSRPACGAEEPESSGQLGRMARSESEETSSPPSRPEGKGLRNAGKKKSSFSSAAGGRKIRPGAMRKRSSQSSGSSEQRKGIQTSPSSGAPPGKTASKSAVGLPPEPPAAAFALSSSSWQDVESPASSITSPKNRPSTPPQPSSWLVDKNFRGKFVENQKRAASSVNLSALGKSQSVRFLDDLPQQSRRLAGRSVDTEEPEAEEAVGNAEFSQLSPALATSAAGTYDECDAISALPRTKSQLSMLIDKQRRYSAGANTSPEYSKQHGQSSSLQNIDGSDEGDDDEKEAGSEDSGKENELLLMALKDKRGMARDPDQPFRAAAKKGLWRGGDDGSDGPQSPPPIF